jgi:hypothetical protein
MFHHPAIHEVLNACLVLGGRELGEHERRVGEGLCRLPGRHIAALGAVEEQSGPFDELVRPFTCAWAQMGGLGRLLSRWLPNHALQALQ